MHELEIVHCVAGGMYYSTQKLKKGCLTYLHSSVYI